MMTSQSPFTRVLVQYALLLTLCNAFNIATPFHYSFLKPTPTTPQQQKQQQQAQIRKNAAALQMSSTSNKKPIGDPLREASGVRPSIHPITINAISEALKIRAQNNNNNNTRTMPLRYSDDTEPYEIMMSAGKIAQDTIQKRQKTSKEDGMMLSTEEEQTLGGRIVAVIVRLEELEEVLVKKCQGVDWIGKYNEWNTFGVLKEEGSSEEEKEEEDYAKKVDEEVLKNPLFGMNRAECLLAIFLETIEKPGLKRNGVRVPCMDVDFLDADRYEALFLQQEEEEEKEEEHAEPLKEETKEQSNQEETKSNNEKLQETLLQIEAKDKSEKESSQSQQQQQQQPKKKKIGDPLREATNIRPSLHPLTINAISEALKIRAQNSTKTPLRQFTQEIEIWEIQYAAGKIAENAIISRQKSSKKDGMILTEEEAQTVAGRIVAVLLRLEDLEWELNHRCSQISWIEKYAEWNNFGILPNESCVKTVDERILKDPLFAMNRAERLLALFLLNLEGPGLKAAGESVPGGSEVDFLEEEHYEIMLPKQQQQQQQQQK